MSSEPTRAQLSALKWLAHRNGEGVFNRDGVLMAGGDLAPVQRRTWARLTSLGLCGIPALKRLELTPAGRALDLSGVDESDDHGRNDAIYEDDV